MVIARRDMQRYDFEVEREFQDGMVVEVAVPRGSINGCWVRFKDAAKLQDRIDALESELEEIKKQGV